MATPHEASGTSDERTVIVVDIGTGGPKVGLSSLRGEIVWCDSGRVATKKSPDGRSTQEANEWWMLIHEAVGGALHSGVVDPEQVVAATITGQWASTVPVDDDGIPVGDCLLFDDRRGEPYSRKLMGGPVAGYSPRNALAWLRKTGGAPSLSGTDPVGHMLYLRNEEPEVHAAARWLLEPVDYLTMRLTGRAVATSASMAAAWLTDNRKPGALNYDADLVGRSGVDPQKLPPLVPTGSVVGWVRQDVADDLGLPEGVRVVAGTPDLHSACVGAGAVGDYQTHLAISTTSWIGLPVPFKKTDALRSIASVPGLPWGGYLVANNHDSSGRCLQWLNENVLGARSTDDADYSRLVAQAGSAPPGSHGVIFTPWLAGERSPVDDHDARGGFHNLSLTSRTEDLIRAVLEGVAYNNRWLHEAVERFAGRRLDPVRVVGGGAKSDLWCQIHADVMNRTIERVSDPVHASLRGQAVIAGVALGVVLPTEVRHLVPVDSVFTPDPASRQAYDRLYEEFPTWYKAQRRMFRRLNGQLSNAARGSTPSQTRRTVPGASTA